MFPSHTECEFLTMQLLKDSCVHITNPCWGPLPLLILMFVLISQFDSTPWSCSCSAHAHTSFPCWLWSFSSSPPWHHLKRASVVWAGRADYGCRWLITHGQSRGHNHKGKNPNSFSPSLSSSMEVKVKIITAWDNSGKACLSYKIVIWICFWFSICQAQQKWKQILRQQCCLLQHKVK